MDTGILTNQKGHRCNLNGMTLRLDKGMMLFLGLVFLTLRFRLFPFFYVNLSAFQYWAMAGLTTGGILLSLAAHEKIHADIARGLAPTSETWWARGWLYLSGIFFSLLLSAALVGLTYLSEANGYGEFVVGILFHLAAFNITLAAFQVLPVLPLDGGRFLLNVIFAGKARKPATLSRLFGLGVLIGLVFFCVGSYQLYERRFALGAWTVLVGLMLLKANSSEYKILKWNDRIRTLVHSSHAV